MSTLQSEIFGPPVHRGMHVLDRSLFKKSITLAAGRVPPKTINPFRQSCAKDVLRQPRLRGIYDRDGDKLIVLRPEISPDDLSSLHPSTADFLREQNIPVVPINIDLDYDYWQADDILSAILPEHLVADSPAGFTMVGHIAHMNLREEYLPFKDIIGQVILDKNSSIRTVVNKLDTIDSVYRNFQMEILAGDSDLVATQHESGCKFRFDFSKVYWNSRLHTEHERLVNLFKEGDAICDVMAGVGPFAIPAAKKRAIVLANDLNPASYESLLDNIQINKVKDFVVPTNDDGRACIRSSLDRLELKAKEGSIQLSSSQPSRKKAKVNTLFTERTHLPIPATFQHYVMNLPATAIEFLDAFRGLYQSRPDTETLPRIHVHCFTKFEDQDARRDLTTRISAALGDRLEESAISFHHVRRVAPNKDMYCCSFELPRAVAFAAKA